MEQFQNQLCEIRGKSTQEASSKPLCALKDLHQEVYKALKDLTKSDEP